MRTLLAAALAAAPLFCAPALAQSNIPDAVRPPAGHKMTMKTVGIGEITYECRLKAGGSDAHEWMFVSPVAKLMDGNKEVGKYYGGPTWESMDGSKVMGKQVAVAPAAPGSIPLQLVKAEPATGKGSMTGVTFIQRLNTQGGVAPSDPCNAGAVGVKKQVKYQADYVFYKQ